MSDEKRGGCAKGALGCGGVGCFLVLAAVAAGFIFSPQLKDLVKKGVVKAQRAVEEHPVYREALERVKADPRVVEKLGTPIETSFPSSISVDTSTSDGANALEVEVAISGPDGEGTLEIRGSERGGEVSFVVLYLWVDGEGLDLLRMEAPPLEAEDGG